MKECNKKGLLTENLERKEMVAVNKKKEKKEMSVQEMICNV